MRLEQCQYFLEVCHTKSMSVASKNLHVTQQTISTAIKNLEEELNLTLFNRTNRGVEMTVDGQFVEKEMSFILQAYNRIVQYKNDLAEIKSKNIYGKLKIVCAPMYSIVISEQIINQFTLIYPDVDIMINEKAPALCLPELEAKKCDISVFNMTIADYNDYVENPNDLQFEILTEDELVAVASVNSPFAHKKSLTRRELESMPLIFHTSNDQEGHWILDELFKTRKHQGKILKTSSNIIYAEGILSGQYLGFYGKNFNRYFLNKQTVRLPLREKIKYYSILATEKNVGFENPIISKFIELLRSYYQ